MTGPVLIFDKPDRHPATPAPERSAAQLEAGNYPKGKIRYQGLRITIENPRGTIRRGRDPGGKVWETSMRHPYGYIRGTLGVDGDHVDCYVGPNPTAPNAYLITTMRPPAFTAVDEQKVMLGFTSEDAAREAYLLHYDNPAFCGEVREMPISEFKRKVRTTRADPRIIKGMILFLRAHVEGYTRRDGVFVKSHDDSRQAGRWTGDERHVPEIMAAVRNSPHRHHGLRVMSPHPTTGDDPAIHPGGSLGNSHVWRDGKSSARQLKGTSTIGIKNEEDVPLAIKRIGSYWGRQVVLVGGDEVRPGADDGERVISNARALKVWHRKAEGVGRGLLQAGHEDHD